jgi:transposase InsO family protein
LRNRIIREHHDVMIAGHFGWRKVLHSISQWYYWDTLQADVKAFVQACPHCQLYKPTKQPVPVILPTPVISRPFAEISMDWVSALHTTVRKNNSALNIIDRFSKWAISIPCDKHMTTNKLIDVLWDRVLSWIGLPVKIVGDRDSRLTASAMRALATGLTTRLALSASYRPQTDGFTERFNRTFLSMIRTCCHKTPESWDKDLPALLYAYNNTVHSATGYTPHFLLFGSQPIDLRVPIAFQTRSNHPDIDSYLSSRAATFSTARAALERARQEMIAQRNASVHAHQYQVKDQVKISTRVLQPRGSENVRKMQPLFVGPFEVSRLLGPKTLSVHLPDSYAVNNAFNFEDVRPWLDHAAHAYEPDYPAVHAHASCNPIMKVLDRRRLPGRLPAGVELIDIPCEYQVLRSNGDMEWLQSSASALDDEMVYQKVKEFELRYPRDPSRPCNTIQDYSVKSGYESPDELPVVLANEYHKKKSQE